MIEKELCAIIIETYYKRILDFCSAKLHDKVAAEDCTQETFVIFFKKRKKFSQSDNLLPWLYKTARIVIMKYKEKNYHNNLNIDDLAEIIEDKRSLDNDECDYLYINLDETEAEMIIEFFRCRSREEKERLAKKYGISYSNLNTKIHRIKKKIIKSL